MKLALIGTGLIGGSAAAAWRKSGAVSHVIGFDIDADSGRAAERLGIVDVMAPSIGAAVTDADLVLLAVPVGAMRAVFNDVAAHVAAHAIITDVGSTKVSVIEAAQSALAGGTSSSGSSFSLRRFVPAHPIAGRELPGVQHADANLFRNRLLITTPTGDTHADAMGQVEMLWRSAGARVMRMDAREHDRVFAAVSHLPHLLAFALVASIASDADGERKFGFAGAGFRDFTRIAAGSAAMWRDVCVANRTALGDELRRYRAALDELQSAVDRGDADTIEHNFELASRARRRFAPMLDAE